MYVLTLYVNKPLTRWSGKPADEDVLIQQPVPWLWLARWRARTIYAQFIPGRTAWMIRRDDEVVEEFAEHTEQDAEEAGLQVHVETPAPTQPRRGRIIGWPKHLD